MGCGDWQTAIAPQQTGGSMIAQPSDRAQQLNPYFQTDAITLYHANCMDVMKGMDDRSVDLVLTDPPFSSTTHQGARSNRRASNQPIDFDYISVEQLRLFFDEMGRVARRWVIATIDWKHAHLLEESPPLRLRFVRLAVWIKPNSMPQLTGDRPAQGWEAIAILHRADTKLQWNGGGHRGVYTHNIDASGIHPTAKPLSLYSELIQLFSDPNDVVFDPFAGSGASLRAAADLGRRAIGVELSPQYVEVAARRCQQLALFS